jgi:hypothetical protein
MQSPNLSIVDIEVAVAALGTHYDPDEAEVIERVLKEYGGTIPYEQLISEAALALVIHRRHRPKYCLPSSRATVPKKVT